MAKRILIFGLLMTAMVGQTAQAGLINYERRSKSPQKKDTDAAPVKAFTPGPAKATRVTQAPVAKPAEVALKEPIKIQNNAERKYDANKDGFLQEAERQIFLKDVVAALEDRGEFFVNSDVIKAFDSDKDGEISLQEAQIIQQSLN